eukprot:4117191-Pleurochrysis_carterae.AAC.1
MEEVTELKAQLAKSAAKNKELSETVARLEAENLDQKTVLDENVVNMQIARRAEASCNESI